MAISINSDADRLRLATPPGTTTGYTVALFFRLVSDRNTWSTIASLEDAANGHSIVSSDGNVYNVYGYGPGGGPGQISGTLPDFAVGTWYFLALHVTTARLPTLHYKAAGTTDALVSTLSGNALAVIASPTQLLIGANGFFSDEHIDAEIAGLKVWSGLLTGEQLAAEADSIPPVRTTDLFAAHALADVATMLTDSSGNARHLTNPGGAGTFTTVANPSGVTTGGSTSITGAGASTVAVGASGTGTVLVQNTIAATITGPAAEIAGAVSGGPVVPTGDLRVMFCGDSITFAMNAATSHKRVIMDALAGEGWNPIPVGSQSNPWDSYNGAPFLVTALGGWGTSDLSAEIPAAVTSAGGVDVFFIMIGTNDIAGGLQWGSANGTQAFNGIPDATNDGDRGVPFVVDHARAAAPNAPIFLATVPYFADALRNPGNTNRNVWRNEWNAALRSFVAARQVLGQRIYLVDMDAVSPSYTTWGWVGGDGLHPDATAHQGMGNYAVSVMLPILLNEYEPPTAQPVTGTVSATIGAPAAQIYQQVLARGAVPANQPERLTIGLFEDHDATLGEETNWAADHWMLESGRPWDIKYRYLTGPYEDVNSSTGVVSHGWANNWGWGGPYNGEFARAHMNEAAAQGFTPAFSYYFMNDMVGPSWAPSGGQRGWEADFLAKCQTPATMAEYFQNFRLLMDQAADFGQPVYVLIEPDGPGFLYDSLNGASSMTAYAAVADSGRPELASLPNTVAGWGQAFLAIKQAAGASNVILGIHVSGWNTETDLFFGSGVSADLQAHVELAYNFIAPMGILPNATGITYDVLVGDPLDRDADTYLLGAADRGNAVGNRWWDPNDAASINSQSFNRFCEWLRLWNVRSGLRWVMWQIPHGTDAQRNVDYDGTQLSGYRDNRPEYFFHPTLGAARRQRWIDAGVISLMFGAGQGDQTTHRTDGNFIRDNAAFGQYVARGAYTTPTVVPGYDFEGEPGEDIAGSLAATISAPTAAFLGAGADVAAELRGTVSASISGPTAQFAAELIGFHLIARAKLNSPVPGEFWIKRGDTEPKLRAWLYQANGRPVPLHGATVTLRMAASPTGPLLASQPAEVVNHNDGIVEYAWQPSDTENPGVFLAELKVAIQGRVQTVPRVGFLRVVVSDDLS